MCSPAAARWLLHVPEPYFLGLDVVGVVAEPGEPFHQPLGGGAVAVPHVDVVAGRHRLSVALPVVLYVDDAGAAIELAVEVGGFRAGDALHSADTLDRSARQRLRELGRAHRVHLLGAVNRTRGGADGAGRHAGVLEAHTHAYRALVAEHREAREDMRALHVGQTVRRNAGI